MIEKESERERGSSNSNEKRQICSDAWTVHTMENHRCFRGKWICWEKTRPSIAFGTREKGSGPTLRQIYRELRYRIGIVPSTPNTKIIRECPSKGYINVIYEAINVQRKLYSPSCTKFSIRSLPVILFQSFSVFYSTMDNIRLYTLWVDYIRGILGRLYESHFTLRFQQHR